MNEYELTTNRKRRRQQIGLAVAILRDAAGMGQEDLAQRVGLNRPDLIRLEGGSGSHKYTRLLEWLGRELDAQGDK